MKRVINEYYVEHDGEEFPVTVEPLDHTAEVRVRADRAVVGYLSEDLDPIDPRGNDNVGTMACWHRNYRLGDEQPQIPHVNYMRELIYERAKNPDGLSDEGVKEIFDRCFISLPLYLYDHSGITMNTTGFSCRWDSGQVGFIYVSKERAHEEWGPGEDALEKATKYLRSEVEEYDKYLTGEVYGVCFTMLERDEDGNWEEASSDEVWGYFGSKHATEELMAGLKRCAKEWLGPKKKAA